MGGGFLGAELAKSLDQVADVTLIEQNSHFVQAPAMIRAVVTPSLLDRALIPYDDLLTRGAVVQDRAVSINESGVELQSGQFIEADYIVVATGSSNAIPFKPNGSDIEAFRAANSQVNKQLV
ncbi:MAG: FAD-dependent oxidoreductase, partial [Thiolinea sp.]